MGGTDQLIHAEHLHLEFARTRNVKKKKKNQTGFNIIMIGTALVI